MPSPQVAYAIDALPGGDRLVRSVGLDAIGQQEIAARVGSAATHEADHRVMGLLGFVAGYVSSTGARITAGQTMEYGWTMLKFLAARPSVLEVHEHADPMGSEAETRWIPGVELALALRAAGEEVMQRNRLTGTAEYPNRGHSAVVCTHLLEAVEAPKVRMDRSEILNQRDSGWSFTCGDPAAPHTIETAQHHHLAHVAHRYPFVVPYVCIPVGCMVVFDHDGASLWSAGSESGARDPTNPYSWHLGGSPRANARHSHAEHDAH